MTCVFWGLLLFMAMFVFLAVLPTHTRYGFERDLQRQPQQQTHGRANAKHNRSTFAKTAIPARGLAKKFKSNAWNCRLNTMLLLKMII